MWFNANSPVKLRRVFLNLDVGEKLKSLPRFLTIRQREKYLMAETPIIIHEHQFQRIKTLLAKLCIEAAARVVFLVDRDGQPIAFHGDIGIWTQPVFPVWRRAMSPPPPVWRNYWAKTFSQPSSTKASTKVCIFV